MPSAWPSRRRRPTRRNGKGDGGEATAPSSGPARGGCRGRGDATPADREALVARATPARRRRSPPAGPPARRRSPPAASPPPTQELTRGEPTLDAARLITCLPDEPRLKAGSLADGITEERLRPTLGLDATLERPCCSKIASATWDSRWRTATLAKEWPPPLSCSLGCAGKLSPVTLVMKPWERVGSPRLSVWPGPYTARSHGRGAPRLCNDAHASPWAVSDHDRHNGRFNRPQARVGAGGAARRTSAAHERSARAQHTSAAHESRATSERSALRGQRTRAAHHERSAPRAPGTCNDKHRRRSALRAYRTASATQRTPRWQRAPRAQHTATSAQHKRRAAQLERN